jgi:hypothetical protein
VVPPAAPPPLLAGAPGLFGAERARLLTLLAGLGDGDRRAAGPGPAWWPPSGRGAAP